MKKKFRLPNEIASPKTNKVPISARIDKDYRNKLELMAKKQGISLGRIVEAVLIDYVNYVESHKDK